MMADKGLSAAQVPGTGRDGRITKGDVIAAAAGARAPVLRPPRRLPPRVRRCRR